MDTDKKGCNIRGNFGNFYIKNVFNTYGKEKDLKFIK